MNRTISIVVPAYNEERGLAESLASIRAAAITFESARFSWELIVCDNNSTDRTAEVARAAGARVVFERVNQISRARNTGAAHATGAWLIFVDADSHPSRELFTAVAHRIATGRVLAGGSTIVFDTTHVGMRFAAAAWNVTSCMTRWAAGSFIFCNAAAFRQVGGFSEQLYASEEIDLFRRLKRLARSEAKSIAILRSHPLRTSARKMALYTPREFLGFNWKVLATRGRALRSAGECPIWYDGRR